MVNLKAHAEFLKRRRLLQISERRPEASRPFKFGSKCFLYPTAELPPPPVPIQRARGCFQPGPSQAPAAAVEGPAAGPPGELRVGARVEAMGLVAAASPFPPED